MTSLKRTLPVADNPALFQIGHRDSPSTKEPVTRKVRHEAAHRRDRRDVFNGRLLAGLTLVGPHEIPKLNPCTLVPDRLIAFSEAVGMRQPDPQAWVHGYEDDYKAAERLWRSPEKYFRKLRGFAGVICPDHSTYRNLLAAQKIHNTYRNQLLGARLQADGDNVIPNVRLNGRESIPYALAGIPSNSTLAVGLHGCTKSRENRRHVIDEIQIICDFCKPANLVVYGSDAYGVLNYPLAQGVPVYVYAPDAFCRSLLRKAS